MVRCLSAIAESLLVQGVGVTIGAESGVLTRWLLVTIFGRITKDPRIVRVNGTCS